MRRLLISASLKETSRKTTAVVVIDVCTRTPKMCGLHEANYDSDASVDHRAVLSGKPKTTAAFVQEKHRCLEAIPDAD
jgi:hypothetical protein